jgi:hypothetical protein
MSPTAYSNITRRLIDGPILARNGTQTRYLKIPFTVMVLGISDGGSIFMMYIAELET